MEASAEVYATINDYVSSILKVWFGQPVTLENWFKKNQLTYKGVIDRVGQVEAKLAELPQTDRDLIISSLDLTQKAWKTSRKK